MWLNLNNPISDVMEALQVAGVLLDGVWLEFRDSTTFSSFPGNFFQANSIFSELFLVEDDKGIVKAGGTEYLIPFFHSFNSFTAHLI